MIYLGADHGGFKLKEQLREYLNERGYQVADLGAVTEEPDDDYPVVAQDVARKVLSDPNNRGILLCRNGVGVCVAANKFKGIRAAQAWSPEVARSARNDDNVNVLCLPADYIDYEQARQTVQTFLDESFAGDERFKRRLKQIEEMEKSN